MDVLDALVTEIERHLDAEGWGSAPRLFALVRTGDLLESEPHLAETLGAADPNSLTPVEQEPIQENIEDLLPRIAWPDDVLGAALSHEIVMVPDDAPEAPGDADPAEWAMRLPEHEELRAVAAVLRTGEAAAAVRVRGKDGGADEVVLDPDVVPNMVRALRDTFEA